MSTVTDQDRDRQRRPRNPTFKEVLKTQEREAVKEALPEYGDEENKTETTKGARLPTLSASAAPQKPEETSGFSKIAQGSAKLSTEKRLSELGEPGKHEPISETQTPQNIEITTSLESPKSKTGYTLRAPEPSYMPGVETQAPVSVSSIQPAQTVPPAYEQIKAELRVMFDSAPERLGVKNANILRSESEEDKAILAERNAWDTKAKSLLSQVSDPRELLEDLGEEQYWAYLQNVGADREVLHNIHARGVGRSEESPDETVVSLWTGEPESAHKSHVGKSELERKVDLAEAQSAESEDSFERDKRYDIASGTFKSPKTKSGISRESTLDKKLANEEQKLRIAEKKSILKDLENRNTAIRTAERVSKIGYRTKGKKRIAVISGQEIGEV